MDYELIWLGCAHAELPHDAQIRLPGISLVGEVTVQHETPCAIVLDCSEGLCYSIPHVVMAARLGRKNRNKLFVWGIKSKVLQDSQILLPESITGALTYIRNAMATQNAPSDEPKPILQSQPMPHEVHFRDAQSDPPAIPKPAMGMAQIAIAGSQSRIGTTTVAFAMRHYCHICGLSAAVIMPPETASVLAQLTDATEVEGGWDIRGTPVVDSATYDYDIFIEDMGVLSESNSAAFYDAEGGILVVGGKPWELEATGGAINMVEGQDNCLVIGAFLDIHTTQELDKLCGHHVAHIGYCPDPFHCRSMPPETQLFLRKVCTKVPDEEGDEDIL